MESLLNFVADRPVRTVAPGEILIHQGSPGGDLFILQEGSLAIERDGVKIASAVNPGALLGEMAVLLGRTTTATVRAERSTRVKVIADARNALAADAELSFLVAHLVAGKLDSTSAYLVELSRKHSGRTERGLLSRIMSVLALPAGGDFSLHTREDLFG